MIFLCFHGNGCGSNGTGGVGNDDVYGGVGENEEAMAVRIEIFSNYSKLKILTL